LIISLLKWSEVKMSEPKKIEIDCGDVLGIVHVAELYEKLLVSLAEGDVVILNVSKIERIDAAALQVIYAYSKALAKQGSELSWSSASEAFQRSAKLLGLTEKMNLNGNSQVMVN
jgi:anti-anti-sigma regulatory factor